MQEEQQLDALEARVFGVLIEKQMTTPDQYPLSLNATTSGCNQKSNRHPVLSLGESEVLNTLNKLMVHGLVGRVMQAGSRVEKFRHNGPEFLKLGDAQLAILAELLMRGPQNPGELRQRASRMHEIPSLDALREELRPLIERGFAKHLPPSPGSRAERYAQLMSPDLHPLDEPVATSAPRSGAPTAPSTPAAATRLQTLEEEVARLRRQLDALSAALGEPLVD
jgi:uncharacterized protein YceH (UPF0502 family)